MRLASDTFNYTAFDRAKARSKKFATERFPDTLGKHVKAGLPPKVWYIYYLKLINSCLFECQDSESFSMVIFVFVPKSIYHSLSHHFMTRETQVVWTGNDYQSPTLFIQI